VISFVDTYPSASVSLLSCPSITFSTYFNIRYWFLPHYINSMLTTRWIFITRAVERITIPFGSICTITYRAEGASRVSKSSFPLFIVTYSNPRLVLRMRRQLSCTLLSLVVLLGLISCWSQAYGQLVSEPGSIRVKRSVLQNFAMERVLKDKGFVRSLINCVLDKGPCDGHGRQLRLMAPEIVRGQCPGCSRKVHNQIRKVISHVQRNFPQEWSEVTRRFLQYPAQQFQNVFGYHWWLKGMKRNSPSSSGRFHWLFVQTSEKMFG